MLWLGYYENAFAEDPVLFISSELIVEDPDLAVSVDDGTALHIENMSSVKVDLSKWMVWSGGFNALIPSMTILAPYARIAIPQGLLRIPLLDAWLATPDGHPVRMVRSAMVIAPREELIPDIHPVPQKTNRSAKLVLCAAGFATLALCILLDRLMAKGE
jgi:hypothetical protein